MEAKHCTVCSKPISQGLMHVSCSSCARNVHLTCTGVQLREGENWVCTLCKAVGEFNDTGLLPVIDSVVKSSQNGELSTVLAWLFKRVCVLTREVDACKQHCNAPPATLASTTAPETMEPAIRRSIIIGDMLLKGCQKQLSLLKRFKDLHISLRPFSNDLKQIFTDTLQAMSDTSDPLQVVIHAGHAECIKLETDEALALYEGFLVEARNKHPGHSLVLVSTPVYSQECKRFNNGLASLAYKFNVQTKFLDITNIQAATGLSQVFRYDEISANKIANVLVRYSCKFVGVKNPLPSLLRTSKKTSNVNKVVHKQQTAVSAASNDVKKLPNRQIRNGKQSLQVQQRQTNNRETRINRQNAKNNNSHWQQQRRPNITRTNRNDNRERNPGNLLGFPPMMTNPYLSYNPFAALSENYWMGMGQYPFQLQRPPVRGRRWN